MKYNNIEEIKKAFVNDGWNKDITFSILSMDEAKTKGVISIIEKINLGFTFFKMNETGNIFDNRGNIVLFNIKTKI